MNGLSNEKGIHVVAGIDNKYVQHLSVTFTSLLANVSPDTSVFLYVLHTGLTDDNQSKLERTVSRFGACIQFISVDYALFDRFPVTGHINRAMYLRLVISEVIPSTISKAIYLDSDIVVTENIAELWEMDLRGYTVAAVFDSWAVYRCKSLQIPKGMYFNSGVMIMNLSKWREDCISSKAITYISQCTDRLHFPDQDALNALLYNDWLELPHKWNADIKEWKSSNPPAIIHYTDVSKPWHLDNSHRFKKEYYKYLRMTEWEFFKPKISWKVVMIRIIRFHKRIAKQILPKKIIFMIKGEDIG